MLSIRIRSRPYISLWPSLLALLLLITTMYLGQWQLNRALEKEAVANRQAQNRLHQNWSPVDILSEQADGRKVLAPGRFLPQKSIWWDNQIIQGIPGLKLIVPFQLSSGGIVLVDRGLWPVRGQRTELPIPDIPSATIELEGTVYIPPKRTLELMQHPDQGKIWQNLTPEKFARIYDMKVYSYLIRESGTLPSGFIRASFSSDSGVTRAAFSRGMNADRHRGYAFQWYSLAGLTVLLWLFFTFFSYESSSTT